MTSDERVNYAMQRTVTELPNGLWLFKGIADEWTLLYPTAVMSAVSKAHAERLRQEKSEHLKTIDANEVLKERIAKLEVELAAANPRKPPTARRTRKG